MLKIGMALVMMVITGVIGFSIVDGVVNPSVNHQWAVNESHSNSTDLPENITLTYDALAASSLSFTTSDGTPIEAGYVTVYTDEGYAEVSADLNTTLNGTTWLYTYAYEGDQYFDSSLSRTIVTYVVPIGLLGLIAIVASGMI